MRPQTHTERKAQRLRKMKRIALAVVVLLVGGSAFLSIQMAREASSVSSELVRAV
jgi:cell division protein FtsN